MYNILSLDGGGSWAILQLLTLKERFKAQIPALNGHAILRQFDLVVANSGGSIVMAALAEDWTIDQALKLFDDKALRERIFSKNSFKETYWPVNITKLVGLGPKYSAKRKGDTFKELFPNIDTMLMDKLPTHIGKPSLKLIVCTYDAMNNRAKFFRSYHAAHSIDEYVRLTQAIHASSNAPVQYFDFPARFKAKKSEVFYELWDGALGGFNNPVVAGIMAAFQAGVAVEDMQVVSLGNANKVMSKAQKEDFYKARNITTRERKSKWKVWKYKYQSRFFKDTVMNQAKTILHDPPDWANVVALLFLSKSNDTDVSERFIRLSPMIHVDEVEDAETKVIVEQLLELDMDLTREEDIDLVKQCFEIWKGGKIRNQPIQYSINRANEVDSFTGDACFDTALEKWHNF